MKSAIFAAVACVIGGAALAQEAPASRFGADDMAGASNLVERNQVLDAAALIRRGQVVSLGRDYGPDMPLNGDRTFELRTVRGEAGPGGVVQVEDVLAAGIGQAGTHLDGLGHVGRAGEGGALFYNGLAEDEVLGEAGLRKLGIEHVRPFFARAVLLDLATLRGGPMAAGDEITAADLEAALELQDLDPPGPGEVVILHTGWGRHWGTDNAGYLAGAPGIGMEAARWLADREVAVVGADTWAVEVQAGAETGLPVHGELIVRHGIFLHENLATEKMIDAEVHEFAYIFAPVPVVGATGSMGAPLAAF